MSTYEHEHRYRHHLIGKNPNRFRKVLILLIGISLVGAYFAYDYMTSENEEAIFEQ